jgi:DNA-binding MarR family transcriptional regulator
MHSQFTERNLVRLIRLVERYAATHIGKMLEQKGYAPLTARHLQVFESIDPNKGSNIVQMAQKADISKQAMSKLVKDAAAAGYVDVLPNPDDNRYIVVKLTPSGALVHQDVMDNVATYYENLLDRSQISVAEIDTLTDTLLKFLKHFEGDKPSFDTDN